MKLVLHPWMFNTLFFFAVVSSEAQVVFSDWIAISGKNKWDIVSSITLDTSGHIYLTGSIRDSVSNNRTFAPNDYLSKFDTNGKLLWSKQLFTSNSGYGSILTSTEDGQILVAGGFESHDKKTS